MEYINSIFELHALIRDDNSMFFDESIFKLTFRPSAKEKFKFKVLKSWWDTYEYDFLKSAKQKIYLISFLLLMNLFIKYMKSAVMI